MAPSPAARCELKSTRVLLLTVRQSTPDVLCRLTTCRFKCRCNAAARTPISLALRRMLDPCHNRSSASSLRGCRHTLQGLLTSMTPLRNLHCEELAVRWLAILPQLLSAFDEHSEMLANQPPCGNPRGMG